MDPIILVSTLVKSHEDPEKVIQAIRNIFPEWAPESVPERGSFPIKRGPKEMSGKSNSLDEMLSIIRKNRILDTALDVMSMKCVDREAKFFLSRQSASIGKVSFVLNEEPLGGVIEVLLEGPEIGLWLEQQTWHSGRNTIPRSIGDEISMSEEGEPTEWFDSKGRRTIGEAE